MKKQTVKSGIPDLLNDSNRYITDKGEISLITPCRATMNCFEIFCIKGDLFEDIERFETIEQAETRIYELLSDKQNEIDLMANFYTTKEKIEALKAAIKTLIEKYAKM